jgi:hypothetical protein
LSYVTLGSRGPVTGLADNTGLNTGNWTAGFTPAIINVNLSQFEVYKIVVLCKKPTLVTFNVYVDTFQWDTGVYGNQNSWDPSQPLIMRPGQSLNFNYSNPDTDGFPPVVWIWLRYDPAIATQTQGQ